MWNETIAVDPSQLGIKCGAGLVHHCAAKGDVVAFTCPFAREVAPEVTVDAVTSGPIWTAILSIFPRSRRERETELPLPRLAEIEDGVPTAVFLTSSKSDYYTGQTLSRDDGDAMH